MKNECRWFCQRYKIYNSRRIQPKTQFGWNNRKRNWRKIAKLSPEKQDDLEEQSKIIAEVYKAHNTNAEELNQLQTNPEELNKTIREQVGNEKQP